MCANMDVMFAAGVLAAVGVVILIMLLVGVFVTSQPPDHYRCDDEKFFVDPSNSPNRKIRFPSLSEAGTLDLSVIVPAYCEEERLPVMMDETMAYLEERQSRQPSFTYEVIIVDDGSKDATSQVALEYTKKYRTSKVRVLTLQKNRGKGGAVRLGMFSSRGKLLLFADADGASKFSDVEKLEKALVKINQNEHNMAVVCGSRAHLEKESIAQRSLFRTILMYGFHFLVWFLCVRGVRDTQCGFKLLTRDAARLLFTNLHVQRWAFDVDLLHIAQHFKVPVAEVGITWQEIEGSKMVPLWSWLQMGRDLLLIRVRYMLGAWKMSDKLKLH